jgi:hypothetical protein
MMLRIARSLEPLVGVCVLFSLLAGCGQSERPAENTAETVPQKTQPPASETSAAPTLQSIKQQLRASMRIDADQDFELTSQKIDVQTGEEWLLVKGGGEFLCSATGNCPYWLFRRVSDRYQMELNLGVAQEVTVERKSKTANPVLTAKQHGSATQSGLRLYQYDGKRYKLVRCMRSDYQDPSHPDRLLDKPRITDEPCDR